jgi:hypothetical protein
MDIKKADHDYDHDHDHEPRTAEFCGPANVPRNKTARIGLLCSAEAAVLSHPMLPG